MQTFEIKGQTDQASLAEDCLQAAQRKLVEAEHFFDDANHWLDSTFTQAINSLPDVGLEFVGLFDSRAGVIGWWSGLLDKGGLPTTMVRFSASRDMRVNTTFDTRCDVVGAEVAITRCCRVYLSQVGRQGKVGSSSCLSLGWLDGVWTTIKRLA